MTRIEPRRRTLRPNRQRSGAGAGIAEGWGEGSTGQLMAGTELGVRRAPESVRASCLQLAAGEPADFDDRITYGVDAIEGLGETDLVALPELWATGYFNFNNYASTAQRLDGPLVSALGKAASNLRAYVAGASVIEASSSGSGRLFNTSLLLGPDGHLTSTYRKVNLFGLNSREPELLQAGSLGAAHPVQTTSGCIGMMVCYDLRFPEVASHLAHQGTEVIVVCAAWPALRAQHWQLCARSRAIETQAFVVACNSSGEDHGVRLGGRSLIVAPWGDVLAEAGDEAEAISAVLDLSELRRYRADVPFLADRSARPICGCPHP